MYCRAIIPPSAKRIIYNTNPEVTLHVPAASLQAYKEASAWSKFKHIVAIDMASGIDVPDMTTYQELYFNLQGRRIQGEPQGKGVYVRGGKKYVKK